MKDFFAFRKMITPTVIRVLYIIGIIILLVIGIVDIAQGASDGDFKAIAMGVTVMILGPIGLRIYMEILIVMFMINDSVKDIRKAILDNVPKKENLP